MEDLQVILFEIRNMISTETGKFHCLIEKVDY